MKIGIVLSRPPGYSETFFRNKISGLINKGFEVELYVDQSDKGFKLCRQHSLPKSDVLHAVFNLISIIFKKPDRLIKFIRSERREKKGFTEISKNIYSCLHLLNSSGIDWIHFGFATMAVGRENIARTLNARMAVSLRGFDISRYPLKHPGVYRNIWNKVDKVHVISNALLQKAYMEGLPATVDYAKISPAIDTGMFQFDGMRQPFPETLRLLTVARLHWSKGLEYTIQALSILKNRGLDFHYTIAGDGKELERIVHAAHQLGISDKITFAGKVDHNKLKSHYENTDIYLQYSVQEGFCNAVLEAQAMGLLCIVSDAEGLPENIKDGESGWVVPRRSPELLADKISEVVKMDVDLLSRFRNHAVIRVKESFNLEQQIDAFVEFYK